MSAPSGDDGSLDAYLVHLRVERGLTANSLESYARDLTQFRDYLDRLGVGLIEATREHIVGYLVARAQLGVSARSQARYLSALRGL